MVLVVQSRKSSVLSFARFVHAFLNLASVEATATCFAAGYLILLIVSLVLDDVLMPGDVFAPTQLVPSSSSPAALQRKDAVVHQIEIGLLSVIAAELMLRAFASRAASFYVPTVLVVFDAAILVSSLLLISLCVAGTPSTGGLLTSSHTLLLRTIRAMRTLRLAFALRRCHLRLRACVNISTRATQQSGTSVLVLPRCDWAVAPTELAASSPGRRRGEPDTDSTPHRARGSDRSEPTAENNAGDISAEALDEGSTSRGRRRSISRALRSGRLPSAKRFAAFISHKKDEAGADARLLHNYLTLMLNHDVFLDSANALDIRGIIQQGLYESETVVFLATSTALQSAYCLVELFEAHERHIPVLVVAKQTFDVEAAIEFLSNLESNLAQESPSALGVLRERLAESNRFPCEAPVGLRLLQLQQSVISALNLHEQSSVIAYHSFASDSILLAMVRGARAATRASRSHASSTSLYLNRSPADFCMPLRSPSPMAHRRCARSLSAWQGRRGAPPSSGPKQWVRKPASARPRLSPHRRVRAGRAGGSTETARPLAFSSRSTTRTRKPESVRATYDWR